MGVDLRSITFDAASPLRQARFWAAVLSWPEPEYGEREMEWLATYGITDVEQDPAVGIKPADGGGPQLFFLMVPEGKSVKNRVHLDVRATTTMAEEVARLVELGATVVGEVTEWGGTWTVMRDPEGNEFCVERSDAERATPTS